MATESKFTVIKFQMKKDDDKVSNDDKDNEETEDGESNSPKSEREKLLLNSLGGDGSQRIFCYKNKAPAPPEHHVNPLRVVYSMKTPVSQKSGATRYISTTPERILDAPDIINDYCEYFLCFFFCILIS